MNSSLFFELAFSFLPQIGGARAKIILSKLTAEEVFTTKKSQLEKIEGISSFLVKTIKEFTNFKQVEDELEFIQAHQIQPLFITHEQYPKRLLDCHDSPVMLYYKGSASLNTDKIVAIVGTRSYSTYGKEITENIISELKEHQITVISGLAYGIDAIAHQACVAAQLPTIGVLAHGLNKIYPPKNAALAKEMVTNGGGILSEYISGTEPETFHFPVRNRIVAGMSDATIVIETATKGGSMITAELANGYNKEVYAVPGKLTDTKSQGCHTLIKMNKAQIFNSTSDFLNDMGWEKNKKSKTNKVPLSFDRLPPHEKIIAEIIQRNPSVSIDDINVQSQLSSSDVAIALLNLEMESIIRSLPGKTYQLF